MGKRSFPFGLSVNKIDSGGHKSLTKHGKKVYDNRRFFCGIDLKKEAENVVGSNYRSVARYA